MSFPKLLVIIAVLLFGTVIVAAFVKGYNDDSSSNTAAIATPVEVVLERDALPLPAKPVKLNATASIQPTPTVTKATESPNLVEPKPEPPEANRIEEFFSVDGPKLPIVETITYKSRVAWQKGRPAWLSDYAGHYQTSRHFIARSLNGEADYFKQDLAEGDKFNVLRKDKNFQFYLLIDLSRARMWFYYEDLDKNERVLVKTYQVGIGRIDSTKKSGFLTPLGKYSLGNKIAIYKPKMMGFHNGDQVEMMSIFGTRWIPFDKEISGCTAPAKGFGIHGTPWNRHNKGEFIQDKSSIGKYQSDGCIRLASQDVEELFAIIITKPTVIELVKDFYDAAPVKLKTMAATEEK